MERVAVATHGHCFDGMCSAAVFTRLLEHLHGPGKLAFTYKAQGYGPGQNGVPPGALDGDINAILDFRFTRAPNLTWYFDHHVSAFPTPEDRAAYEAMVGAAPRRAHHDGAYGSCTKLIADVAREVHGMDTAPLAELIHWADKEGLGHDLKQALFSAYFTDQRDVSDIDVLTEIAGSVGLDADEARDRDASFLRREAGGGG